MLGNANSTNSLTRRRSAASIGDLDITPMIDVTFLLLIFFMVTSTMKATPVKDIPAAESGTPATVNDMLKMTILNSASSPDGGTIMLEGRIMTRDELQMRLMDEARGGAVRIMIYAERDVKSGFVGDVEDVVRAVEGDVSYQFAVQDFR